MNEWADGPIAVVMKQPQNPAVRVLLETECRLLRRRAEQNLETATGAARYRQETINGRQVA